MNKKIRSRVLVVDADVVRAAGVSEHPASSSCRKALEQIKDICHHVITTDAIDEEWNKHASSWSRLWKIAMLNRRKLPSQKVGLASIKLKNINEDDRIIIEKDRHLLDAAVSCDHIIITLDEKLQKALERTGNEKMLRDIKWLNPKTLYPGALENL